LSGDRLIGRYWARRRAAAKGGLASVGRRPEPSVSANFAIRLIQFHLCLIYFASGCSKLLGTSWWSGTAVWLTMANYSFAPLNNKLYQQFLKFLTEHRWLWETIMNGGV